MASATRLVQHHTNVYRYAHTSRAAAHITTPFGILEFLVEPPWIPKRELSVVHARFAPKIPPGMSVRACYGVLLRIEPLETVFGLQFKAKLSHTPRARSGASTGEGLEALEWEDRDHVMVVGTEDREYLERRLPKAISLADDPFTYASDSLSIRVEQIPAGVSLSLHFVVAWNRLPERVSPSCWFAADQKHAYLVDAL